MTQYMRPSSDINTAWSSGTTTRYGAINEVTPVDTLDIWASSNKYQECKLSAPQTPLLKGSGVLRFRAKQDPGNQAQMTPSIRCGTTVIKTGDAINLTTYAEYTLTLSQTEMSSITDWTDVRVRFTNYDNGTEITAVSWAVLEVPDAVPNQVLRPDKDYNSAWICTEGTERYTHIDEETPSDADYISGYMTAQVVGLSPGRDPGVDTGMSIVARVKGQYNGEFMIVKLLQGSTEIVTVSSINLTTSFVTKTWSMPEANVANITNFRDLRLSFESTHGSVLNYVSYAHLELPGAPDRNENGLEMGCSF